MSTGRFRYRAASSDGRIRTGTVEAESDAAAARRLTEQGLAVLGLRPALDWLPSRPPSRQEVAVVFRNVATLVGAGVPVERALAVSEPLVSARLAARLGEVRRRMREGSDVGDALASAPDVFPRAVIGIVRAGEGGSALADACAAAADHLEESARLDGQVRSALAYPALILLVGLATIAVMGTVVVPRFALLLRDLGAELPPATRALLFASDLLARYGSLLVVLMVAGVVWAVHARRATERRAAWDSWLLRVPLVGALRHAFATARTCRALGSMLERGMPLLAALDAAADATGDLEVSRRLACARDAAARGTPLTQALRAERAVSPLAVQLIGVGESSGRLGGMVSRAAEVTAEQAARSLRTTVGLLEPLLVITLGVAVAGVAAALLQAVYSIRPG